MPKKTKKFPGLKFKKGRKNLKERVPFPKILYLSVAFNLIVIFVVLISLDRLPPEIPLYYGLPEGSGQLAEKNKILIPSLTTLGFIFLNVIIVFLINNEFLKKALVITCLVLSIFSLTTTIKIMFLVGSF